MPSGLIRDFDCRCPEVPAGGARALALRLVVGTEDCIPDDEADDNHYGDCADEQRQFGALPQRPPLVLVEVVDRVEGRWGTVLTRPTAGQDRGGLIIDAPRTPWRGADGPYRCSSLGGSTCGMGAAGDASEDQPLVRVSSRYSGFG